MYFSVCTSFYPYSLLVTAPYFSLKLTYGNKYRDELNQLNFMFMISRKSVFYDRLLLSQRRFYYMNN